MTETFAIIPASGRMWFILAPIVLILLLVLAAMGRMIYSSQHARFEIGNDGLTIKGAFSRHIPFRDIDIKGAEVIDLEQHYDLQPSLRTIGIGLPGYRAGWFRLRNGDKALLYVTASNPVVHLTTMSGYTLLLSVSDSGAFLASLRNHSLQSR